MAVTVIQWIISMLEICFTDGFFCSHCGTASKFVHLSVLSVTINWFRISIWYQKQLAPELSFQCFTVTDLEWTQFEGIKVAILESSCHNVTAKASFQSIPLSTNSKQIETFLSFSCHMSKWLVLCTESFWLRHFGHLGVFIGP